MILRSFSWLAVNELVQAAEASVVPVREGVAKPQARSTGSSISNSLPNPNGGLYPGRFRCRPGRLFSKHIRTKSFPRINFHFALSQLKLYVRKEIYFANIHELFCRF